MALDSNRLSVIVHILMFKGTVRYLGKYIYSVSFL